MYNLTVGMTVRDKRNATAMKVMGFQPIGVSGFETEAHYVRLLRDDGAIILMAPEFLVETGLKTEREALEERGRASKTTPGQPDQPTTADQVPDTTPELRICGCGDGFPHFHGTLHL